MKNSNYVSTPVESLWNRLQLEATELSNMEPILTDFIYSSLLQHNSLGSALSFILADKLKSTAVPAMVLREVFEETLSQSSSNIVQDVENDIIAIFERDAACDSPVKPLLFFKGFHALQTHRIAHWLWNNQRQNLALYLQSQMSIVFSVDIHPAARIGSGVMLDHATGFVVGETCVIEDNVSILQSVTLGGTGKEQGDRHPKIRRGVLIGAGAKILGNIEIGEGAKVGAGSVVLKSVKAHTTVAGVPAKVVGENMDLEPALGMDHNINHCIPKKKRIKD